MHRSAGNAISPCLHEGAIMHAVAADSLTMLCGPVSAVHLQGYWCAPRTQANAVATLVAHLAGGMNLQRWRIQRQSNFCAGWCQLRLGCGRWGGAEQALLALADLCL